MSATGANTYLAMIKQDPATPDVMPATPALTYLNWAEMDVGADITTSKSNNVQGTRRLTDITITGFSVGGGIQAEMMYQFSPNDELMLAAIMCEKFTADVAKDGDFVQPFYFEKGHRDIKQYFKYFGMAVDTWTMEYKDSSMVECSFGFVGLKEDADDKPSVGATYVAATDNPVFSTITNISDIKIDGVATGKCEVKEFTVEVNNNITGKTGVGVLGACETNAHKIDIGGKFTAYFTDLVLYNKLLAGTPFSFEWTVKDANGNGYTFLLPKCKLESDKMPVKGSEDILTDAQFVALGDATADCAIQITNIHP